MFDWMPTWLVVLICIGIGGLLGHVGFRVGDLLFGLFGGGLLAGIVNLIFGGVPESVMITAGFIGLACIIYARVSARRERTGQTGTGSISAQPDLAG